MIYLVVCGFISLFMIFVLFVKFVVVSFCLVILFINKLKIEIIIVWLIVWINVLKEVVILSWLWDILFCVLIVEVVMVIFKFILMIVDIVKNYK